jgi:hypothetical protein
LTEKNPISAAEIMADNTIREKRMRMSMEVEN